MNNRGEQLEHHEILKAKLLNAVRENKPDKYHAAALIWDACADIDGYVLANIKKRGIEDIPDSIDFELYDTIQKHIKKNDSTSSSDDTAREALAGGATKTDNTLKNILTGKTKSKTPNNSTAVDDELTRSSRYRPIINFPNFLLIALHLYLMEQYRSTSGEPNKDTPPDKIPNAGRQAPYQEF